MKKKILFFLSFILVSPSFAAYQEVYSLGQASFTLTNDVTARISTNTMKGGLLLGVVIDSPSVNGTLTLADAYVSTSVAGIVYSTFAILSLAAGGNVSASQPMYIPFGITLSSGLAYTTSSNIGGVTIIYKSIFSGR